MITITKLAADTRYSQTTVYAAIKRLEIKPHKQKRNSLLIDRQKAPYYYPCKLPPGGAKTPCLLGIVNRIPQTGA